MSFADLDKKVATPEPAALAAAPAPLARPPRTLIGRAMKRVDLAQAATGVFIFAVTAAAGFGSGPLQDFARRFVELTVVCELYLIWLAMGCLLATDKPGWLRIPILLGAAGLYVVAVTHDRQFQAAPQALWLLCARLLPQRGAALLSNDYVRRLGVVTWCGLALLVIQLLALMLLSTLLVAVGIGTRDGNAIIAPRWFYALLWGAYYIELAFLMPWVASLRRPGAAWAR